MNRLAIASLLALLALAPPAAAAVSTPHSGWLWGNPEPQGHHLTALELQGNTGFASGAFGTLLRTTDAGATWATVRTGMTFDLTKLEMIDTRTLVTGFTCALRRSDDGGATFRRLPFTASEARCARRLSALSFPTSTVGYLLLEDGGVLKTADGGRSFAQLTGLAGVAIRDPGAIAFGSATAGLATTPAGEILRTVDGGATWTREYDGELALHAVLLSGTFGVAVGDTGTFLVSNDGGDTWTRPAAADDTTAPPDVAFTSVRCSTPANCLLTTRDAAVMRTADGGRSFTSTGVFALAVDFASASRAVAVGADGATFVSDDGGGTFARVGSRLASGLGYIRVRATSAGVAHAIGAGGVLARTTDGGETWSSVGVATRENLRDVSFPTAAVGYVIDQGGGLFRTENGGATWSILDTGDLAAPLPAVLAPDESVVLLVGPTGVLRSTDSGETFAPHLDGDIRRRTLVDADRAGGSVVVWGPRVIAVSGNRGRTWRRIVRPTQRAEVRHVDFQSARAGYVLATDGRLYSTRNGGRDWAEVIAVGRRDGVEMAFGDGQNGWLRLGRDDGVLLRTSDGGRSWRRQTVAQGSIGSIAAGGPRAAFATGSSGHLLFTADGGDAGDGSALTLSARPRKIERTQRVRISGRLRPADGGEQVILSARRLTGTVWSHSSLTTDAAGRFSATYRLRAGTVFVAQWAGDADSAGDGTRALVVRRVPSRP